MSQYPPPPPQNPDEYGNWQAQAPAEPTKHSGLGIASLIVAIVCILMLLVGTVISTIAVMDNPQNPDESPMVMVGGLVIIAGMLGCMVGVVLGAVGCAIKKRKRVTAIIGVCLNAMGVIGICGLMLIGMATGA